MFFVLFLDPSRQTPGRYLDLDMVASFQALSNSLVANYP
jgi:hypothetical protein